ncbi:integron cassette protein [Candidatus Brocadia pituitae]|nr:integron cassette protein [Candidatus Brocadia pituitae]
MRLLKRGKDISVSIENITPFGIWLFVKGKEYFLSYKEFPCFKDQTVKSIQNVQLLHEYHLYWHDLDIDLEIDNLENPEKYPLKKEYPN